MAVIGAVLDFRLIAVNQGHIGGIDFPGQARGVFYPEPDLENCVCALEEVLSVLWIMHIAYIGIRTRARGLSHHFSSYRRML